MTEQATSATPIPDELWARLARHQSHCAIEIDRWAPRQRIWELRRVSRTWRVCIQPENALCHAHIDAEYPTLLEAMTEAVEQAESLELRPPASRPGSPPLPAETWQRLRELDRRCSITLHWWRPNLTAWEGRAERTWRVIIRPDSGPWGAAVIAENPQLAEAVGAVITATESLRRSRS